jgi:hypothetical protein
MTKYTRVQKKTEERRWNVHPIWRGIGCAMILIIIVMSYALAKEFIDTNEKSNRFDLPNFLYNKVFISYTKYIPAFKQDDVVNKFLANFKVGTLIFTLIFMFIGFGAFSFAYSALYRVSGPSRYSPLDAPPVRRPRKRM